MSLLLTPVSSHTLLSPLKISWKLQTSEMNNFEQFLHRSFMIHNSFQIYLLTKSHQYQQVQFSRFIIYIYDLGSCCMNNSKHFQHSCSQHQWGDDNRLVRTKKSLCRLTKNETIKNRCWVSKRNSSKYYFKICDPLWNIWKLWYFRTYNVNVILVSWRELCYENQGNKWFKKCCKTI